MEHQPWVLQQWIEVAPFGGGGQHAVERVRGEQDEGEQADADQAQHRQHARHHNFRQLARGQRHRSAPAGQHQHPEQQRAFVAAPYRRETIQRGQLRIGVVGNISHRKVIGQEALREADESDGDQQELRLRGWACQSHPLRLSAELSTMGTDQRQQALSDRNDESEDECEVSEFGSHGLCLVCGEPETGGLVAA
jgi:hypothetical protein